ncbi:hypothetical protein GV819_07895 [Pseudomonas sp. Fl5BN2]|uniref:hypothetical protein n=1 Tax=Pseudomonas sp. Fl5BN2 TaxID=2697652 RepID=UPI001376BE7D|nr:hypothetical protein [Pseudomonas sp. Fl5BN2]NBF02213.1 hypothetical protein [Pseudomonas sp. Fl5BN2]
MTNQEEKIKLMAYKAYKADFENGSTIKQYQYIHSVLSAISFTFFLALFSAGDANIKNSLSLQAAIILFSISLITNVLLFTLHYLGSSDRETIWQAHLTGAYNTLETMSWSAPFFGTLALIWFYFIPALLCSILTISILIIGLLCTHIQIKKSLEALHEDKISAINNDDIDTLKRLDAFKFNELLADEEKIFNQYNYEIRIINETSKTDCGQLITLHHQVSPGDIVKTDYSTKNSFKIIEIIHTKNHTTLNCTRAGSPTSVQTDVTA